MSQKTFKVFGTEIAFGEHQELRIHDIKGVYRVSTRFKCFWWSLIYNYIFIIILKEKDIRK